MVTHYFGGKQSRCKNALDQEQQKEAKLKKKCCKEWDWATILSIDLYYQKQPFLEFFAGGMKFATQILHLLNFNNVSIVTKK